MRATRKASTCRCSCSRRAMPSTTRSPASTPAPTTTSPSLSTRRATRAAPRSRHAAAKSTELSDGADPSSIAASNRPAAWSARRAIANTHHEGVRAARGPHTPPGETLFAHRPHRAVWDESWAPDHQCVDAYVACCTTRSNHPFSTRFDQNGARRIRLPAVAPPSSSSSVAPAEEVELTLGHAGAISPSCSPHGVAFRPAHEGSSASTGASTTRSALRAHDVAAATNTGDAAALLRTPALPAGQIGDIAQVVDSAGRVVAATPVGAPRPARRPTSCARRSAGASCTTAASSLRVLAEPVGTARRVVVVGGTSTEDRDESLADLAQLLLIGGPVALLLASLAGSGWPPRAAASRGDASRAARVRLPRPTRACPLPEADDEIRGSARTLNEMLERLAAPRASAQFVADASHELRTPLAILKAELERAAARWARSERAGGAWSPGGGGVRPPRPARRGPAGARSQRRQRAADAGGPSGSARRRCSRRGAAALRRPRPAERGRSISVDADPGAGRPTPSELRLGQAVGNLVDNALRYGEGGGHASRPARARRADDRWCTRRG